MRRLAIDEKAKAFLEGKHVEIGRLPLFLESLGHSGQPQFDQAFVSWMNKHW